MLKTEDNEMLVRVGPKTPMGDLMRMYWLPFLLSDDVPADASGGRRQGVLLEWNDERGFGFITPSTGGERVFVHVR